MHLLLTNDDGIEAPGLAALLKAVSTLPGMRVSIVAPATEQSMCGHRVTTREALHVESRGEHRWAVHGTPADCVRIGLFALGLKPDWVISGVNAGGNLGQDIVISGTIAAAREATYHGVSAMAFSHYLIKDLPLDWERVAGWVQELIVQLSGERLADGEFWNVNLPHLPPSQTTLPEQVRCTPARLPLKVEYVSMDGGSSFCYTAAYSERPQDPGSDVEACFAGCVSITRLHL